MSVLAPNVQHEYRSDEQKTHNQYRNRANFESRWILCLESPHPPRAGWGRTACPPRSAAGVLPLPDRGSRPPHPRRRPLLRWESALRSPRQCHWGSDRARRRQEGGRKLKWTAGKRCSPAAGETDAGSHFKMIKTVNFVKWILPQ